MALREYIRERFREFLLVPLRELTDEEFRTAVLLGLASAPLTVVENWFLSSGPFTARPMSGVAFGVACLAVGYLYAGRPTAVRRAGKRAGFVGSSPFLVWWAVAASTGSLAAGAGQAVAVVVALVGLSLGLLVLPLVGMAFAIVGGWLRGKVAARGAVASGA